MIESAALAAFQYYNIILGIILGMERTAADSQESPLYKNTINRYLATVRSSMLAGGAAYSLTGAQTPSEAWIFRDDIGAPNGIKGYEE